MPLMVNCESAPKSLFWVPSLDPELFCTCRGERYQELCGTLQLDCLWFVSAKNNKVVSDWSIKVCTRAVERAACLAFERLVFPCKCWNKHDRPMGYSVQADSWFQGFQNNIFARLIRENYWIFQFSIKKKGSYISKIDPEKELKVKNKIKIQRYLCQL